LDIKYADNFSKINFCYLSKKGDTKSLLPQKLFNESNFEG
jgi:hypothetical protein